MKSRNLEEEAAFLAQYDMMKYDRPSVTADVLAVEGERLLLIRRGGHPYRGCWALVGGFVEMEEDIVSAAKRELAEETSLRCVKLAELGVYGSPGRDPRGRVISVVYLAQTDGVATGGDDAAEAAWFAVKCTREGDVMSLELEGAEHLMIKGRIAQNALSGEWMCEELLESDLAFDHGRIVLDGWLRIRRWEYGREEFDNAQ